MREDRLLNTSYGREVRELEPKRMKEREMKEENKGDGGREGNERDHGGC